METMTPKEKAEELVNKFDGVGLQMRNEAIACALICVYELINDNNHNENIVNGGLNKQYWIEVKTEINKL